ncbi:hypothetical protein L9W86_17735 [Vibrio aestuarianus]|nr:hypothetical protein [Vibrio aestuarianus]
MWGLWGGYEKQIRAGAFLENCMLVHRYSGCIDGGALIDIVHSQIVADKCLRVNELALKVGHTVGEVFATVLRLVSIGLASMDLESSSLTETSLVKAG